MNKFDLFLIRWLDSCDIQGWKRISDWRNVGTLECVSVGFLIAEDETTKTIAPHLAFPNDQDNTQGAGIMVIPARSIISMERLPTSWLACASEDHSSDHPECELPFVAHPA